MFRILTDQVALAVFCCVNLSFLNLSFLNLCFLNLSFLNLSFLNLSFLNLCFLNFSFLNLSFLKISHAHLLFPHLLSIQILTNSSALKPVPTRFDRALLKDFSQVEERFKLAAATHQVSVFTDGVLAMRTAPPPLKLEGVLRIKHRIEQVQRSWGQFL
jgi:hypothetical protein